MIKSSKLVGMKSVNMLCNPIYDKDQLTISTKCKGRGIGDVASYGLWQLIQEEDETGINNQFTLLSFEDDFTMISLPNMLIGITNKAIKNNR